VDCAHCTKKSPRICLCDIGECGTIKIVCEDGEKNCNFLCQMFKVEVDSRVWDVF
jgi:hypothetical protein